MKPEDFCYFLQGIFEIADLKQLNEKQTQIIKNHLALVFHHIDNLNFPDSGKKAEAQLIHDSGVPSSERRYMC